MDVIPLHGACVCVCARVFSQGIQGSPGLPGSMGKPGPRVSGVDVTMVTPLVCLSCASGNWRDE